MTDVVDVQTRSRMMSRIGGRDTAPERRVRRYLHAAGLRFRLCDRSLPGCPDIVFRNLRTAVFVHGCFWHRHDGCRFATTPSTRQDFWLSKFEANRRRDSRSAAELVAMGWSVFTIWECETRDELSIDRLAWSVLAMWDVGRLNRKPAVASPPKVRPVVSADR